MLKQKNKLDYEYFNRYLKNCGYNDISELDLLDDFFKETIKYVASRTRIRTLPR